MKRISTVLLVLLAASCGTDTVTETGTGQETIDPYADPPGYAGDPFAGYGPVTTIELPAGQPAAETVSTPVGNWSVQIAACGSMESAQSLVSSVSTLTDEPVFIDHIGSYYKVRVGAFTSPEESGGLREMLRSRGYPDAWSVEREPRP